MASVDYVESIRPTMLYVDHGSRRKYPAMRQMFHDPACPITTKYVCWFDDDSWIVDPNWLTLLGQEIVANHSQGTRMYGTKFIHDLMPYRREGFTPEKWFQCGGWWKSRWLYLTNGRTTAPNGSAILFCTGGFWALATETIRVGDIPDVRLNHNGGDICLGAQVHQTGAEIKDFCRGKKPVRWSDAPRRGYHEVFPWTKYR
jgi:hypothetical protein